MGPHPPVQPCDLRVVHDNVEGGGPVVRGRLTALACLGSVGERPYPHLYLYVPDTFRVYLAMLFLL